VNGEVLNKNTATNQNYPGAKGKLGCETYGIGYSITWQNGLVDRFTN